MGLPGGLASGPAWRPSSVICRYSLTAALFVTPTPPSNSKQPTLAEIEVGRGRAIASKVDGRTKQGKLWGAIADLAGDRHA